jgi:inner membrane protein
MPSIFTHAVAGACLAQALAPASHRRALTYLAAATAVLPDADVIGFRFGVSYGDLLGHRGLTHSLLFACVAGLASIAPFWATARAWERFRIALCIAVATASYGILDAFTNGGRGVAFFAPFDASRYFFPVTPIEVAPLSARAFFSERGLSVFSSELMWVWGPALLLAGIAIAVRSRRAPA